MPTKTLGMRKSTHSHAGALIVIHKSKSRVDNVFWLPTITVLTRTKLKRCTPTDSWLITKRYFLRLQIDDSIGTNHKIHS